MMMMIVDDDDDHNADDNDKINHDGENNICGGSFR